MPFGTKDTLAVLFVTAKSFASFAPLWGVKGNTTQELNTSLDLSNSLCSTLPFSISQILRNWKIVSSSGRVAPSAIGWYLQGPCVILDQCTFQNHYRKTTTKR